MRNGLTRFHNISNFAEIHKYTGRVGMDHALFSVASNDSGNAGIRDGTAFPNDASQPVAAIGFHHHIHILPGRETGAECNGQGCHIPRCAKILFGKDRIHKDIRLCGRNAFSLRVYQNRNGILFPDFFCLRQSFDPYRTQTFNGGLTFINGFAQRNLPPDRRRMLRFQHQHTQACAPQPVNGAGSKVAAAAHKDQCILLHLISSPGWSRVNTISIDPPQAAIAASSFLPSAEKCSR